MSVIYAALFAAYMFLHTTTLQLGSHVGTAELPAAQQEFLYYAHQVFIVLGFLSFAPTKRFLTEKCRRALTISVMSAYALGTAVLYAARGVLVSRYIASATIFCLGYLGGLVYWRMSDGLRGSGCMGMTMGVGCAAAYALQFLFHLWHGQTPLLPAVMLLAFAALVRLLACEGKAGREDAAGEKTSPQGRTLAVSLLCACAMTVAMIVLVTYYDGYIERMQVSTGYGAYNAFGWPRLLLVPCYLLLGRLGDVMRGRYISVIAVFGVLAVLLTPVLIGENSAYWLNLCIFYIAVAVLISYYNLTFWRLAPHTKKPELWACMGRVLDGAVGVALGLLHFSALSVVKVMVVEVLMLGLLLVAFFLDMERGLPGERRTSQAPNAAVKTADDSARTARFAQHYGLTPKETAVFRELVLTDADQQAIADVMGVQVSTLQKHCNAIYRKTGAANRIELCRSYEAGRWDANGQRE